MERILSRRPRRCGTARRARRAGGSHSSGAREGGDSIDRFPSSHALAAYAGLVPTTRSSGGKTAHEGLGKASNRWRKWIRVVMMRLSGP